MDNHSFPDGIHVFMDQHPDNDTDIEVMPELVPLDARGSRPTQPQQQSNADVELNGESSNMLSLASFSDSSYEDHDDPDSESSRDAHEVEMQTVNYRSLSDHAVPNPSPTSHTALDQPAVNNRRARVEGDGDEDRDRRHPSQRIGNSANAASSAGPSSSTPLLSSPQVPTAASQPTPGSRLRGQAPIFTRTVVDEAGTVPRTHPFRFFQHLMSNNNNSNDNNDASNINPAPSSGAPAPAPLHQDGNTPDNQHHGHIETFSVTVDIGLGPAFAMGGGAQPHEGEAAVNPGDPNLNANPNDAQNPNIQGISIADFMARLGQAIGIGDNGPEGTGAAPTGDNPAQGTGGAGATPGAQFGFNIPGGFNLANLAGLGFGFNFDGSSFGEEEDPKRARKLVDGLEEVPVGLVRRLERVATGGGMGEDETKGGDGGCAICWDRLLGSAEEAVHQPQECEKEEESERTQPETSTNTKEASDRTTPKIVSLPCAHVFHAECLIPWFSRPRQTTCPTCRFNIDPENLTYVSWRRRMRERRERERAEARARDPENADGNEAGQDGIAPPTAATVAEPAVAPLPDTALAPGQVLTFLSRPLAPARSQTPDVSVPNVRPTPAPRSSSQPPASSSSSLLLAPTPSTSQPTFEEGANEWDTMPELQDASNSDEEDDEDEDEDEDEEDGDGAQEEGHGIQAPPVLPHTNEPPTTSTPGSQGQAQTPRPRQNDPLAPRTIQTAHGLITFIPVPFNFPFPAAGNGVGVGVQAGGNGDYSHSSLELPQVDTVSVAATANSQVPPAFVHGQGQIPNGNANVNAQGEYMCLVIQPDIHIPQYLLPPHLSHSPTMYLSPFLSTLLAALPQGYPLGLGFPHFHVQLPHMPEFGAQRGVPAPAPANTPANNANTNLNQAIPTSPFVNAQEAAAITHTEAHLMQHLRSQGLTTDDAENIRRSTLAGRQADRLRRGENPAGAHLDMEDEDEDDMMMDIDEGMGMVVDLTMNQGGIDGIDGAGTGTDPAIMAQNEMDRQDFDHVMNFFNHAARQAQRQAQAGTQTQGQAPQPERGTQEGTPSTQNASQPPQPPSQQQQPQQQPQPQQQQGQGFVLPNFGNFGQEDDRTMNDFVTRMFANLGGPQLQVPQQAPQAERQNDQPPPQPQPQSQPQAGQEPAGPNPTNTNNNGGRTRQQAQFAFSNVTFGPFTNFGTLFGSVPFNPNGTANANSAGAGQERVKKAWTLPPAPGPTLRQRIERREREAGLRCYDISCGVGPSDEDPIVSDEVIATGLRQLMIMNKNHGVDGMPGVCMHTFHPGCLVSAERVALGGADVNVIEGGDVEVSCPVCRSAGCVTKQEWEEGILALS